ncbi:MAG: LITAF-like zinc ribbon domain-containing protein [Pyrinomonadaceae bacterium]
MNPCQNCGKLNTPETNFCRFCGTKFTTPEHQPIPDNPYDHFPPRPYAWQTDEFQPGKDARKTLPIDSSGSSTAPFDRAQPKYPAAPLMYQQTPGITRPFRCPNCMTNYPPRLERRISTGGWITFAVLLVVFFPLFWIGLLIKEDVYVCQGCNSKIV